MASGTEMMINAAIKALGIDPKQFLAQVAELMKMAQTFDARLSAMENDIRQLKEHFNVGICDGKYAGERTLGATGCAISENGEKHQ